MTRTLLLTRAQSQAEVFAAQVIQNTGFLTHIAAMQEMRDLPAKIDFDGVDALVFTSVNGITAFARRWDIRNIPCYCVGPATTRAAEAAGMTAFSAEGNLESLEKLLHSAGLHNPLHIHGLHVARTLPSRGSDIAIYEQVALPLEPSAINKLAAGEIDAVAVFSPRSGKLLAQIWQPEWVYIDIFCISAAAAEPIKNLGKVKICNAPNAASMIALLAQACPSGN